MAEDPSVQQRPKRSGSYHFCLLYLNTYTFTSDIAIAVITMNSYIKSLLVVVSLVAVIRMTNAATAFEMVETSPDGKCFRSRDNLTLAVEESKIYPECYQETCQKQDDKMILFLTSCGTVMGIEGCETVEDKTKPYPACCPTIKCP